MKTRILLLVLCFGIALTACKKDPIPGPEGPTGPAGPAGPKGDPGADSQEGKTFIFSVNWSAGDTWALYDGINSYFTPDDMVLVYWYWANYGNDYYILLPVTNNGIFSYAEVDEIDGSVFVNHENESTGTSPFTGSVTYKYKAILIPSSQKTAHPGLDFSDYEAVVNAYNL